ncbi:phage tail tape measure protein [Paenarthrobacter sp. AT5]|uniref:phage tail tape measure protein n=1 Tax=Paenarthrobacter TaxID=1742992 RepID=UPI001A996E3C|nr:MULTISPECIES: phage tail tape measure protein [Paenarthrobacter]WOC63127.1 phage tail tape measure protein [Paenarthrobacter sp. AT5]
MRTAQKSAEDFASRVGQFAKDNADDLDRVGRAGMVMGGLLLAGVGMAIKSYADFDKQMSAVQASTHATSGDMELLRQAAIEAGADTAFSATEAAQAIDEMAKAGVSTADILGGGLKGALSLAAAGQIEVGEAAEIAASAMTQFKLSGQDLPHIADLLAAGAGKAQGSVKDMGMALNQVGLIANQTGLSIEETTGGLAAFASAGLLGSDAGTSFKTMLQRLVPQSAEAKAKMTELGISAYDAQGNFVGLSKFSENLKTSMQNLTPEARSAAMSIIFGSDAVRAANVLYEQGGQGIEEWTNKVNDAGFAAETAALKQNNLAGDFEKLTGSIESVFLKSGSGMNDFLRGVVQGAEDLVDAIGKIPAPILSAVASIAGVTGGTLLLGGAFLSALPRIQEGVEAFRNLERSSGRAAAALKGAGLAAGLAAIATVLASIQTASDDSKIERSVGRTTTALLSMAKQRGNIASTSAALDHLFQKKDGSQLINGVTGLDSALTRMFNKNWEQSFSDWGEGIIHGLLPGVKGASQQLEDSFKTIDDQLASFVSSGNADVAAKAFEQIVLRAKDQGVSVDQLREKFPEYSEALKQAAADAEVASQGQDRLTTSMGQSVPVTDEVKQALEDLGLTASGTVVELDKYAAALVRAGLSNLSTADAARNYNAALDAVTASIKSNGTTMDTHTEKGRANEAALLGIASAGLAEVEAMGRATDAYGTQIYTSDQLHAKMLTTYNDLVAAAGQFGITGNAADTLARKALGIPDNVDIQAYLRDFASAQLDAIGVKANALNGKVSTVTIRTIQETYERVIKGGPDPNRPGEIAPMATGGRVRGPGTGTSDEAGYFALSDGEYVLRESAARAIGYDRLDRINGGATHEMRPMGYQYAPAGAPAVTRTPAPAAASGPMQMTGTLTMDSGEVLGVFRGVATAVARSEISAADAGSSYLRKGR